ncbi:MAG: DMT family transporter [Saprospiraceae bacterium]|nr:DMT family transporter [Saprospiraceae bacterium]
MKNILYLLIATATWGLNFFLAKLMMESSSALEAGFWRYFIAVFILIPILWKQLPSWKIVWQNSKLLLGVGLVGVFGFNYFFFIGLSGTSAINAALIMSLNPALTLVLTWIIYGQRITPDQGLGILLAFFGVLFLISKGKPWQLSDVAMEPGDTYMWIANFAFATYHLGVRQYKGNMENLHFTFFTTLISCFCFFLVIQPYSWLSPTSYPADFWYAAIGMGGPGTALAYFAWNRGAAGLGLGRAAVFMNTVPFFTSLFALLFGATLYLYHLWSGLLIIAGLLVIQWQQWRSTR